MTLPTGANSATHVRRSWLCPNIVTDERDVK